MFCDTCTHLNIYAYYFIIHSRNCLFVGGKKEAKTKHLTLTEQTSRTLIKYSIAQRKYVCDDFIPDMIRK